MISLFQFDRGPGRSWKCISAHISADHHPSIGFTAADRILWDRTEVMLTRPSRDYYDLATLELVIRCLGAALFLARYEQLGNG
jgi:hypothetical protein